MKKTGSIVITGRPNVGKSTLLNWLCQQEVAIMCHRPQTTQQMISHVFENDQYKIGYIDTPGLHRSINKLSDCINEQIKLAYKHASACMLVVDANFSLNEEDLEVITLVKSANFKKIILVVNKIDLDKIANCYEVAKDVEKKLKVDHVVYVSSLNKTNYSKLLEAIDSILDNSEVTIPNTVDDDDFLIIETIREQIIRRFRQEIPYSVCPLIKFKKYDPQKNLFDIFIDLVVEKTSQKPIIFGKNCQTIKEIRIAAIKRLKKYFDCDIRLNLFVVVRKNWRNDKNLLKQYGFITD